MGAAESPADESFGEIVLYSTGRGFWGLAELAKPHPNETRFLNEVENYFTKFASVSP